MSPRIDSLAACNLETVCESLLVLDDALRVVYANPSYRQAESSE